MNDARTIRLVAASLAFFAMVGLVATAFLLYAEVKAEGVALVSGLTGTALGGLGSLLASTRSESK